MSETTYSRIYAVVRRIPRGRVATYGQVAALAGLPHAPRVAGYALHALPEGTPVPWHRVVAAGGRLTLGRLSPDGAITQGCYAKSRGTVLCSHCGFTPVAEAVGALELRPGSLLAGWRTFIST